MTCNFHLIFSRFCSFSTHNTNNEEMSSVFAITIILIYCYVYLHFFHNLNYFIIFVVESICCCARTTIFNIKCSNDVDRCLSLCFNILWCTHQFSLHIYGIPVLPYPSTTSHGNCFSFLMSPILLTHSKTNHDTLCMRKTHKFPFALTE